MRQLFAKLGLVLLMACSAAGGCGGSGQRPPAQDRVVLQPGVVILPADGTVSLVDVTTSSMKVRGSTTGIGVGSVVVSGEGAGLARKVVAVSPSADGLVCQTENAALTDIFKNAKIRLRRYISASDIESVDVIDGMEYIPPSAPNTSRSLLDLTFKFTDTFPGAETDKHRMTTSAEAKFKIEIGIDVTIVEGALISFTIAPSVVTSSSLELGFKHSWVRKYPATSSPYATLHVNPLHFMIGPVPILITPKLTFSAELEMKVEGGAKVKAEVSATYRAGVTYDAVADQWTPIREALTAGSVSQTPNSFVNAEASLSLAKIGLELSLYNIAGPELEIDAGKVAAKWEAKASPDLSAKLSCALVFSVTGALKGDAFGKSASYSFGPKIEYEYPFYEKSYVPGGGDVDVRNLGGRK